MKTDFSAYASLLSASPADAERLAAWLANRESAKEAMKMEVDETVQDGARLAAASDAYDEEIAVGQIRILSKRYTAEPEVLPYVAVIDRWDGDMWLVLPFSPYKTPATAGEMVTGLDAYGLHVLQAWNGRTVQEAILKNSYLFGALPEKVREDALSLFRHEFGGVPLPGGFTAERGTLIVVAEDPRIEYQNECMARLQPLSDAVLALAEAPMAVSEDVVRRLFDRYHLSECDYALAAATDELNPRVPVLMAKGAWDAMCIGREASNFSGYSVRGGGKSGLIFYLCDELPKELAGETELGVSAYDRETRKLVGTGILQRLDDGQCRIHVRLGEGCEAVDVRRAEDLVLVLDVR